MPDTCQRVVHMTYKRAKPESLERLYSVLRIFSRMLAAAKYKTLNFKITRPVCGIKKNHFLSLHSAAVERMLRMMSVRPRSMADLRLETLSFKASSSSIIFLVVEEFFTACNFHINKNIKQNTLSSFCHVRAVRACIAETGRRRSSTPSYKLTKYSQVELSRKVCHKIRYFAFLDFLVSVDDLFLKRNPHKLVAMAQKDQSQRGAVRKPRERSRGCGPLVDHVSGPRLRLGPSKPRGSQQLPLTML